jgi:mannose-1-phosphate guanylyltransferase/mannose-6-phosphate isomerase
MTRAQRCIIPVLMSGGTGSRLWPLSRESYPKQLLSLLGDKTLLQETALRVVEPSLFGRVIVIANAEHRFLIAEQLRELDVVAPTTVLEPIGRNTAPAATIAALVACEMDPDAIILVMPVDHVVRDVPGFHRTVTAGLAAALDGRFALFGVRPTSAATGYGYIRIGQALSRASGVHDVQSFVEKPDRAEAERYLALGDYFWNSGIFLLPAREFLDEVQRLAPAVLAAARKALAASRRDLDFLRLADEPFKACPSISLDYAVMEKTDRAALVPAHFDWTDVGSWSALWTLCDKDTSGNAMIGDVVAEDVRGCYLRGEGLLVAALGVEDLVVTATPDVVLVTTKHRDQDVKTLVDRLRANGHQAATQTACVHRPWGYYQSLHAGERFQVKRITVNPGGKLSLQKHFHRAEH